MNISDVYFTLGTHLDLFWMGTSDECLQKGDEIIQRALNLCKEYEEYCFYIETTIFAEHFLKNHPEQREYFLSLLKEERLEISGVYVDRIEHSHGGESIIRHATYGIKWQQDALGVTPTSVMHPDLPGLSPQIPQIYAKANIKWYLQARGGFQYGSVRRWEAPDGSNVIYCNLPLGYGKKSATQVKECMQNPEGFPLDILLIRGGYGDLQMPDSDVIELLTQLRADFPDVHFSIASPSRALESYKSAELPVISGELPFGWGSAPTIRVRLFDMSNRLENLLLNAEKFSTIAEIHCGKIDITPANRQHKDINGAEIPPGKELQEAWRFELFTQDHNYAGRHGAQSEFDKIQLKQQGLNIADDILNNSLSALASNITVRYTGTPIIVFNPLSWPRDDVVSVDVSELQNIDFREQIGARRFRVIDESGQLVPYQFFRGEQSHLRFHAEAVPALGYSTYYLSNDTRRYIRPSAGVIYSSKHHHIIENDFFTVKIDIRNGTFTNIYDKEFRKELVGDFDTMHFGELISYEDPGVDVRYDFTGTETRSLSDPYEVIIEQSGPVCAVVSASGTFLDAKVKKEFVIYHQTKRIDVNIVLYWWGKTGEHIRLSFPFAARNYQATWYGVPFYAMQWPQMMCGVDDDAILHSSAEDELNPDDRKHFREVMKWLDVQYATCGVTLATRCTTFHIDNHNIQPVLLRTQFSCGDHRLWSLNPGKHEWNFSLFSHPGDWKASKAYQKGWELNNPLIPILPNRQEDSVGTLSPSKSFLSISPENVIATALKKADNDDAIILRVVEMEGTDTAMKLDLPVPIQALYRVNLLEENIEELQLGADIPIKAHSIETFKLVS